MQLLFRKFPLTYPRLGTYQIPPNVNRFFQKVMRLVNFFMTLIGPVSIFLL